jgi:hypothetical protein
MSKCPDEETGINSVNPSTNPKMIAAKCVIGYNSIILLIYQKHL